MMSASHCHDIIALTVPTKFSRILKKGHVVQRRGIPKAVILGIQDNVRLVAPEMEVLSAIGEQSKRNRTDRIPMRVTERIIKETRKDHAGS
jgi:hypothetical protein